MKNTQLFIFFIALAMGNLQAQMLKGVTSLEGAKKIKESSITVVVASDDAKKVFEKALGDCWSFTKIDEIVVDPNLKSKNEEDGKMYMKLRESKSESLPSYTHSFSTSYGSDGTKKVTDNMTKYSYVSSAYELVISEGGNKSSLAEVFIPLDEEEDLTDDMVYYGLETLQEQLDYLIKSGAKNTMSFIKDKYNSVDPLLKNKTLLVLENQVKVGKKETMDDVLSTYTIGKIDAVDYEKWNQAVVNKEKDMAYLVIVPIPVGGAYVSRYFIMDCSTGNTLAAYQPSAAVGMKGSNVEASVDGKVFEKLSGK